MKKYFLPVIVSIFFLISCKEKENTETSTSQNTTTVLTPGKDSIVDKINDTQIVNKAGSRALLSSKDSIALLKLTGEILTRLKTKNYLAIAEYIDPVLGVRFSPYAYIDTINDVVLSKQKFSELAAMNKQDTIVWGEFDAKEEPIRMTLDQYMKRFVYDVDFAKPEKRSVDKILKTGNSLNNLLIVYKDCHFTESYFSGFEEKYGGMDWRTLRLVFKKRNKEFYLVAIVHDEWTI